jgi:hypothetical protein
MGDAHTKNGTGRLADGYLAREYDIVTSLGCQGVKGNLHCHYIIMQKVLVGQEKAAE